MPQPLQPDVETWRKLTTAPFVEKATQVPEGGLGPTGPKTNEPQDVKDAKQTLHRALTLCLNKVLCPLILKTCWNFVYKYRPLGYTEAAAICLGAATLQSFSSFSEGM